MAKNDKAAGDGVVVIKKYANRRLYDTAQSRYITLDDLAAMIRDGREFAVKDAKSGDDITHAVLTQIIVDEEARGPTMLPVRFLRQIIALYGDSVQSMVPSYLDATMDSFRAQQEKMGASLTGTIGTDAFAKLAQRNMAMFGEAAKAFGFPPMPGAATVADGDDKDAEIARLTAELEALKAAQAKG